MNTSVRRLAAIVLLTTLCAATTASAQPDDPSQQGKELPLVPRQPTGYLGTLGTYHTIEGVLYEGGGKVESNTLLVDIVDGERLDKPIYLLVKNARIPSKVRCVLKGYELGEMIGRPPAEYDLTKELGGDSDELAKRDATAWRWRPFFVPLIATEPKGLDVSTEWGITKR